MLSQSNVAAGPLALCSVPFILVKKLSLSAILKKSMQNTESVMWQSSYLQPSHPGDWQWMFVLQWDAPGVVLQLEVVSVAFCGWRHIGQTHLDSSRDAVEETEHHHSLSFHPCSVHIGWLNNKACLAKEKTAKMTMRRRRMVFIGYLFESAHTKAGYIHHTCLYIYQCYQYPRSSFVK